jgi:pimeloyl-ACP methyl ester carboxylesterase
VAEVLVLVPGYLSGGHTWRAHGAAAALQANGWEDGGNLVPAADGPRLDLPVRTGGKRFYTVELPSEAPLPTQLSYLKAYIEKLRSIHGDERLILAGHSAGGVLARYFMVTHPDIEVDALLTIASPHSGTGGAELGEFIGQSPLGWVTPMLGLDTINRSQGLYRDLGHPDPWSLLGWLNTQPHPDTRYVSIVRPGDSWVDVYSLDMNYVPALAGRSQVLASVGGHALNPGDGELVARLLAGKVR